MKAILKILMLFLTLVLLCYCKKEKDPRVNIPDNNFLNALIELGVDKDLNGIISPDEASSVQYLDVKGKNITTLTGIEAFINMETLICYGNQIFNLDLSHNIVLDS